MVMTTVASRPNTVNGTVPLSENTPFTSSPTSVEDATTIKEYGLVQGSKVMSMSRGTPKLVIIEHCMLRQSSEMVQSPEVAWDKTLVLRVLREAHIWDSVAFWGHAESTSGGVGKGEGITGGAMWEEHNRVLINQKQQTSVR